MKRSKREIYVEEEKSVPQFSIGLCRETCRFVHFHRSNRSQLRGSRRRVTTHEEQEEEEEKVVEEKVVEEEEEEEEEVEVVEEEECASRGRGMKSVLI